jgi:hypothetical protein
MTRRGLFAVGVVLLSMATMTTGAWAQSPCTGLPTYTDLKNALVAAVKTESSGLNLNMWGTIVARDGTVWPWHFPETPSVRNGWAAA